MKGLQAEYGRLSDESTRLQGGATTDLSSEVQRSKDALRKAEADRDAAIQKADAAEKARRTAENNADALLTQTKVTASYHDTSDQHDCLHTCRFLLIHHHQSPWYTL